MHFDYPSMLGFALNLKHYFKEPPQHISYATCVFVNNKDGCRQVSKRKLFPFFHFWHNYLHEVFDSAFRYLWTVIAIFPGVQRDISRLFPDV